MRVFVGYGYNDRDAWIHQSVYPILRAFGLTIADGKDIYQENSVADGVKNEINQSQAMIGFCTRRLNPLDDSFTHPWVTQELAYADAQRKPILIVKEDGVNFERGILGNRAYIALKEETRLDTVVKLVENVKNWRYRRLQIAPPKDTDRRQIARALKDPAFKFTYRTKANGRDSEKLSATLERVGPALYFDAPFIDDTALVEVEGKVGDKLIFFSGWESVEAQVNIDVNE